jgi:ATP-binding cassette subfamily F protein 3
VEDAEENMVEVRRDDKTIRDFTIPAQDYIETIVKLSSVKVIKNHAPEQVEVDVSLRRGQKLLVTGPNGIGKSTLLRALAGGETEGAVIGEGVKVGYYRQDFSGLDFNRSAYEELESVMEMKDNEELRATAAEFLLSGDVLRNKVGSLSEGQKGLLCFAKFVLQKPGLLILDEPTNHINFRHLPAIAKAIQEYKGAVIMVSHMEEFVKQVRFTEELDLGRSLRA